MPMLTYAGKESPVGITTDTCDAYLVAAVKGGDHQAYAELCRRHSKQILRTVLRITRNIEDAEDTLQEALLKSSAHIGGFGLTSFAITTGLAIFANCRTLSRDR